MEENSLGIIGGMGPKATAVFYEKIIENTSAHKDQDHIDMVILNHATLPDRTKTILEKEEDTFLTLIHQDIKLLEYAGVANIAIPCNTAHFFYDKMQEMTQINIINMVEETVKSIYLKYGKNSKIGILATSGTISSGIYEAACHKYGMELYTPSEKQQEKIMKIIYTDIKGELVVDATEVEDIINDLVFKKDCSCIIIACTELSCIELSEDVTKHCIDAMNVLVQKSIELSGKHILGLGEHKLESQDKPHKLFI